MPQLNSFLDGGQLSKAEESRTIRAPFFSEFMIRAVLIAMTSQPIYLTSFWIHYQSHNDQSHLHIFSFLWVSPSFPYINHKYTIRAPFSYSIYLHIWLGPSRFCYDSHLHWIIYKFNRIFFLDRKNS